MSEYSCDGNFERPNIKWDLTLTDEEEFSGQEVLDQYQEMVLIRYVDTHTHTLLLMIVL